MRGRLFVWSPVFLGTGVGLYFLLPLEPGGRALALLAVVSVLSAILGWRVGGGAGPLLIAVALLTAGLVLAAGRANTIAAAKLEFRFYGAVEGRVVVVDRSGSDAVRLTLDQVRIDGVRPERTPKRIRVSLHGQQGFITPEPGLRIITTAHLSAPSGPVEPGGFDFQRMAWFRQIGAVGYTRVPVLAIAPAVEGRAGLFLHRLRMRISNAVQVKMPGEAGAFAAAIMTGDRAAIGQATLADLRGSNLAHLLAISGLHMGLLTGFVFAALRYVMALAPWIALRFPVKKIAALLALAAGAFYLALSGGNVATQRAFIMVAVMFIAVLFDRRALTLRSVAMAALIVLVLRPEALTGPGFQMSFSATTALVAVFGWIRDWPEEKRPWRVPRWARPMLAVVISSAVAGAATAPFAAAHFNQVSYFGLMANLLAVPVMGMVVMPGAVLAGLLTPIGLSSLALIMIRPAINWILAVAGHVSSMEGAIGHVVTPGAVVLPLVALGGLLGVLFQGRARCSGVLPLTLGFVLWSVAERPDLLISPSGGLVGLMGEQGRALNKPRGEGFLATSWLENDGDAVAQDVAFARAGFAGEKGRLRFELGSKRAVQLSGRGAVERVEEACIKADVVILSGVLSEPVPDCLVLDRAFMDQKGTLAIYAGAQGWRIVDSATVAGKRLWNTPAE
ncbi:MAG: ComEC family competence protein [Rhodobacteraceae bacterium]|nr:ComEC family competence protein [Paracoccaceae bacterium]